MGVREVFWVVRPEFDGEVLVPTPSYNFCPATFSKIFRFFRHNAFAERILRRRD
jgi:hypothetical protein